MSDPEFDKYADEYDRVLGNTIPDGLNEDGYFAEYKVALMASRLDGRKVTRILDFGCGAGRGLPYLAKYFPDAELWGYDVSPLSLKAASSVAPRVQLCSDWRIICGKRFDAVIAANVFHHIPVDERLSALTRCRGVLNPDGQMFLFEHNPYNPLTRWIFERCPFDRDAQMLGLKSALTLASQAGYRSKQHGYTLFFPRQLAFLRGLEPWLKRLPLGAQYFVQMAH